MATVTVEKIISTAKSLVGKDEGAGCDIMKWYGGFSTTVNAEACCCAGQMYLFNKAGALSMIPNGKTASCGQLALNFYNAGQLYKPSEVKVGDLVIFSWSGATTTYNSKLRAAGYKTFDHVEICTAVGTNTITTIGANNGGTECDDFQIKTRNKSNISACCRPKYATSATTSSTSTSSSNSKIKTVQTWLNKNYSTKLTVDGIYGAQTKKAIVKALQTYLNKTYSAKLTVDGVMGAKTKAAIRNVKQGASGMYVCFLQAALICNGYDTGGFDGEFGAKTTAAVKSFQTRKKLTADGIAGQNTFYALLV
jgi:peptidoglycan hydrolase-like protein with peptidoglycan-binding domain